MSLTDMDLTVTHDLRDVEKDMGVIELLTALEKAGALTPTSLDLTDPEMPFQQWESLARFFGRVGRSHYWWIGDWLIFGEAVFGQESYQAVESTTKERYSEAERVTGYDHGTLMNIRSICARIPKPHRRPELGFWIHQEVASLDPDEQVEWLQLAIESGFTQRALREAIRESKNPSEPDSGGDGGDGGADPGMSISERQEEVLRLIVRQAQVTSDGSYLIAPEVMAQARAALGED